MLLCKLRVFCMVGNCRLTLPCHWSSRVEKRKLLDPVGALKEKFLRPSPPLFHPQVGLKHTHTHSHFKSRKALGVISDNETINDTCTLNKNHSKEYQTGI